MSFSINLGAWNSVFAVPSSLVDQHIKLAGALQLKVLLWVLRHAGEPFSIEDISRALGANCADIKDAMAYWKETGMIAENTVTETITPADIRENIVEEKIPEPVIPAAVETEKHVGPKRIPKPDGVFIAERISQSEEIAFLMQEAQQILGRPISPGLSSTLLLLHDDYGLPADVILMLLQYVKGRGKDSTSYIEAVGRNWSNENIDTHQKVEEKLRKLDEIAAAWQSIQQVLGIEKRSPSAREEQYANRWILEWNYSTTMIREAYERCVNATGKMSLSYMNRILERWHKEGIHTPEAAAKEMEEKNAAQEEKRRPTYDLDEYERWSQEELMRLTKE